MSAKKNYKTSKKLVINVRINEIKQDKVTRKNSLEITF